MKHLRHILIIALLAIVATACHKDEPAQPDRTGFITVDLVVEGLPEGETPDLSEYGVAIVPQTGFIYSAQWKDITWPIEAVVGTYTIAAASPWLTETDTEQTCYYGEAPVTVVADQTSHVTVTLHLQTYPRD